MQLNKILVISLLCKGFYKLLVKELNEILHCRNYWHYACFINWWVFLLEDWLHANCDTFIVKVAYLILFIVNHLLHNLMLLYNHSVICVNRNWACERKMHIAESTLWISWLKIALWFLLHKATAKCSVCYSDFVCLSNLLMNFVTVSKHITLFFSCEVFPILAFSNKRLWQTSLIRTFNRGWY